MNNVDDIFSIEEIESAYLKFKTSVYYDNTLLYYFKQIAAFENCPNYKSKLKSLADALNGDEDCSIYYKNIDIICAPKSIDEAITIGDGNHRTKGCHVNKILPIISCSVELHILDVLLTLYLFKENSDLIKCDTSYSYDVNGDLFVNNSINLKCKTVFNSYINNYSKWKADRNTAIRKGYRTQNGVIVFKTDIKSFYFGRNFLGEKTVEFCKSKKSRRLYNIIYNAIIRYNDVKNDLKEYENTATSLPVGFHSSKVFSEIYGLLLDKKLKPKTNCLFYGRYVDDICVVCKKKKTASNTIESYLPNYVFCQKLFSKEKELVVEINSEEDVASGLSIMDSYSPSIADFLVVNEQDQNASSDSYLFNIVNETTNINFKLKDVLNDYNHTLPYVCVKKDDKITDFDRFLLTTINKISAVRFYKYWPSILRYALLRKNNALSRKIVSNIEESIGKLIVDSEVFEYNYDINEYLEEILKIAKDVSKASIGYSNKYMKSLMYPQCGLVEDFDFEKLKLCPRIIEMWELSSKYSLLFSFEEIVQKYFEINGLMPIPLLEWDKDKKLLKLKTARKNPRNSIVSLILHAFSDEDAEKTIDNEDYFNTFDYLDLILKIFRDARINKTKYLIGHECFVPYKWKTLIAYLCYKYKTSFIAGFQYHKIDSNEVSNCVFDYEFFNYGCSSYLLSYVREKFIYSPHEDALFGWKGLNQKGSYFSPLVIDNCHIRHTMLLCYELTNITIRDYYSIVSDNKIDILFLPVLNRDTEYFNNLVFSYCRDAYICIAESNTSIYKGTGIYMPYKTVLRDIASGHGGKNSRIVVTEPDIADLIKIKNNYYNDFNRIVSKCYSCKRKIIDCKSPEECVLLKAKYKDKKAPTKKF